MPSAKDIYKADLAEFSYLFYEKFLQKIFYDSDVSQRHKTLLYLLLNRCVSKSQLAIMFGGSKKKTKSTYMMMSRLIDKDYISKYIDVRNSKSKNKNNENIYLITSAGIKYCKELITSLLPDLLPDVSFKYSDHEFSLDEVMDYLDMRCQSKLPAYIEHYLGSRDIYAYLLSHPVYNGNYKYETEVGIAESGVPISLYTRSLLGFNLSSLPIRTDALLTYPLHKGSDPLRWFIELDTGTQRAAVLTDKLRNYLDNYINTNNFSPMSSLLFSFQTKVDETSKEFKELEKYGSRDYYYMVSLEFGFNMLKAVLPEGSSIKTVGDAIQFMDRLNTFGDLKETDELVYKYFKETKAIDKSTPLQGLKNNYHDLMKILNDKKTNIVDSLHNKSYLNRRDTLHKCANSLHELEEYFLKGFSLYTASNFNLGGTLPYLLPEMFGIREKLSKMFLSLELIKDNSFPGYRPFYKVDNNGFVLKNSYYYKRERLHVIVENITDDLGGIYRIRQLLNHSSIPSSLLSSKIICLYDENSLDKVRDMFSSTSIGKSLMKRNGSRTIDDNFEVLFASYKTLDEAGSLFVFNENGEPVYK